MLWPTPAWLVSSDISEVALAPADCDPAQTGRQRLADRSEAAEEALGRLAEPVAGGRLGALLAAGPAAGVDWWTRPRSRRRTAAAAEQSLEAALDRHALPERLAPEGVPGSTKASSLNSASGATTLTRISITAGSAVPIAFCVPSARCAATPLAICTPMPSTITISTGVNAAAWNHRRLFQNQERVASATSPAADERSGRGQHQQRGCAGEVDQDVPDARRSTALDPRKAEHGGHRSVGDVLGVQAAQRVPVGPGAAPRAATSSAPG